MTNKAASILEDVLGGETPQALNANWQEHINALPETRPCYFFPQTDTHIFGDTNKH